MDRRITEHPILDFSRPERVSFKFNGREIKAYQGESIASALFAAGVNVFRRSPKYNHPRGWFCGIGKCSSCLMTVNGVPNVRICVTPVEEGLEVKSQSGWGKLPSNHQNLKVSKERRKADILVVGAGPAGLSAAITASNLGLKVLVVDDNPKLGGQLIKQTHKFFGQQEQYAGTRGIKIATLLLDQLDQLKAEYVANTSVIGYTGENKDHEFLAVKRQFDQYKLIQIKTPFLTAATGARENRLPFTKNYLPGIYGAGGVQTLMNVYGVKPGRRALVVGAGNVGLILAYQLLQAKVEVKAVVEARAEIGGYLVHASKIIRLGCPLLLRHTIVEAKGETCVNAATIAKLDEDWQPIPESRQELEVDLICLGVGLTPSSRLLFQAGCKGAFIPELGGWVPVHDKNLCTNRPGLYVAGDASGIEEASTAMAEGKIAAASIAQKAGVNVSQAKQIKEEALHNLDKLRDNPFGQLPKEGKKKVWELKEKLLAQQEGEVL